MVHRASRTPGTHPGAGAPQQGEMPMYGDRKMYTIKCSECGKDDQVPFQPKGDRPVYCRDCFRSKSPRRT